MLVEAEHAVWRHLKRDCNKHGTQKNTERVQSAHVNEQRDAVLFGRATERVEIDPVAKESSRVRAGHSFVAVLRQRCNELRRTVKLRAVSHECVLCSDPATFACSSFHLRESTRAAASNLSDLCTERWLLLIQLCQASVTVSDPAHRCSRTSQDSPPSREMKRRSAADGIQRQQ